MHEPHIAYVRTAQGVIKEVDGVRTGPYESLEAASEGRFDDSHYLPECQVLGSPEGWISLPDPD